MPLPGRTTFIVLPGTTSTKLMKVVLPGMEPNENLSDIRSQSSSSLRGRRFISGDIVDLREMLARQDNFDCPDRGRGAVIVNGQSCTSGLASEQPEAHKGDSSTDQRFYVGEFQPLRVTEDETFAPIALPRRERQRREYFGDTIDLLALPDSAQRSEDLTRGARKKIFVVSLVGTALFAFVVGLSWRSFGSSQEVIVASVSEALASVEQAAAMMGEWQPKEASEAFEAAAQKFHAAQERFSSVGFGLVSFAAELPLSSQLTSGKALLDAGVHIAEAGEHLSRAFGVLTSFSPDSLLATVSSVPATTPEERARYRSFETDLLSAAALLSKAAAQLERVEPEALPEGYRAKAVQVVEAVPRLRSAVDAINGSAHALAGMLGMEGERQYLILLENSAELRPTGGFVGNIGLARVQDGALKELRVEDVYLFDGQLTRYTVPPKPVQDISAAWSLHDANWYRDFETTAKIASGFFEETGLETPDGVIALTSKMFERLLSVTGPIAGSEGLVVNAETFTDTLNAIGAVQRPGETTQVRAVAGILPPLLERIALAQGGARDAFLVVLKDSVASGDVQVWMRDPQEQQLLLRLGVAGELPSTSVNGDMLAVVHANINGFKTDHVLSEQVRHEATVAADGSVVDLVTITRRHHGDARSELWYRKVNKTYTRFLVPLGSVLLGSEGATCVTGESRVDYVARQYRVHPAVEAAESSEHRDDATCVTVGEENGFTSFGAWLFVSPGETVTFRIAYRLPFRLEQSVDSYRLRMIKQPGWEPSFEHSVAVDASWQVVWSDDAYQSIQEGLFSIAPQALTRNRFFGLVLKIANSK